MNRCGKRVGLSAQNDAGAVGRNAIVVHDTAIGQLKAVAGRRAARTSDRGAAQSRVGESRLLPAPLRQGVDADANAQARAQIQQRRIDLRRRPLPKRLRPGQQQEHG